MKFKINIYARDVSWPEGEKYKAWKSVKIWDKSLQDGLKINKSAGILTSIMKA